MKYLIPIFIIVSIFLTIPGSVFAQDGDYTGSLLMLLDDIRILLFWIGLGIALIVIIVSGIMYMTAGGDEAKVTKAKKTLIYGIVGAAVVLAATFILNAIRQILASRGIGGP